MKNLKYCLLVIGIILLSFSCKKKKLAEEAILNEIALDNFFEDNNEDAKQHWTVSAEYPFYLVSAKGIGIYLPANSLVDANGDLVTGDVNVSFIEIDKKSEMVLLNKSTACVLANGDRSTLISDGEFYVDITQNGEELTHTEPLLIYTNIPFDDSDMRKFVNISENEDILWEISGDSILFMDGELEGMTSFYIPPGESWGWTNLDKYATDPRPKTGIYAELPEGFDDGNTEIYVSFDNENALAHFGFWVDGRFAHSYPTFPIGLEVHFVAVSMDDENLHYAIQSAIIGNEHVEVITGFEPVTQDALGELIDNLP
ncbi:MAG: hypothetical protein GQ574_14925 [Crocinitomix sp.]|nr:hypothetical protein [Crocinitomix sp.]